MSKIITFRGQLPIGVQEKLHLSTNDGLTGYRIKKFQVISSLPGASGQSVEYVAKIYTTDQTGNISAGVDFSDTDLLAAIHHQDQHASDNPASTTIIFDKEMFNQDIYLYITDADGDTVPANFYVELEQFKININEATVTTLKNLRSNQQL